jgi:hypothetical protein
VAMVAEGSVCVCVCVCVLIYNVCICVYCRIEDGSENVTIARL